MLSELGDIQESDESIWNISMTFEVETRSEDGNELVHKKYNFGYAKEWDTWTFHEYVEKRTPNTGTVSDRNWRDARHIMWGDVTETPSVEVPPEVAEKLREATGADSITMELPAGGIEESKSEVIYCAE